MNAQSLCEIITRNELMKNMRRFQFLVTLSIMELVNYPDEDSDEYEEDYLFNNLLESMEIEVPFKKLYERYFETPVNTGDVLIYRSNSTEDYIIFDTYKEPYDQLDLIRLGVQTGNIKEEKIREIFRSLYDRCRTKIHYREGQVILGDLADPCSYPKRIQNNKMYKQLLKIY